MSQIEALLTSLTWVRSRWFTRRAIGLHVTAGVLIPTFLCLGDWQLHRALSGNELSWAYTFEWPIFAIYGTYMWWKIVHDIDPNTNETAQGRKDRSTKKREQDRVAEREVVAYNAYLSQLHEEDTSVEGTDAHRQHRGAETTGEMPEQTPAQN